MKGSLFFWFLHTLGLILLRKLLKSVELSVVMNDSDQFFDGKLQFTEGTRVQFIIHLPGAATKFVRFLAS